MSLIGVVLERTAGHADDGQGLVEYALIILLVAIALVSVLGLFASGLMSSFSFSASQL